MNHSSAIVGTRAANTCRRSTIPREARAFQKRFGSPAAKVKGLVDGCRIGVAAHFELSCRSTFEPVDRAVQTQVGMIGSSRCEGRKAP